MASTQALDATRNKRIFLPFSLSPSRLHKNRQLRCAICEVHADKLTFYYSLFMLIGKKKRTLER